MIDLRVLEVLELQLKSAGRIQREKSPSWMGVPSTLKLKSWSLYDHLPPISCFNVGNLHDYALVNRTDFQVLQVNESVKPSQILSLLEDRKDNVDEGYSTPLKTSIIPFNGFTASRIDRYKELVESGIDSDSVDVRWKVVV